MKNACNRNCLWNLDNSCCPETDEHYKDGTVYTKKCSQYLHKDFLEKHRNVYSECKKIIFHMNYSQLKKARYALSNISKEVAYAEGN